MCVWLASIIKIYLWCQTCHIVDNTVLLSTTQRGRQVLHRTHTHAHTHTRTHTHTHTHACTHTHTHMLARTHTHTHTHTHVSSCLSSLCRKLVTRKITRDSPQPLIQLQFPRLCSISDTTQRRRAGAQYNTSIMSYNTIFSIYLLQHVR